MASKWTEERVEQLKKLWLSGFTARQIADRFGDVSRNAVIGKANRLGLSAVAGGGERRELRKMAEISVEEHGCQWPVGQPGDVDFKFCGGKILQGYPYCENHCRQAYRKVI